MSTETPTRELALRRRAAIAAGHLRQWVNDTRDRRPNRKELKGWVRTVLDERHALFRRATDAERDFALARERGDALEARLRAVLAQPAKRTTEELESSHEEAYRRWSSGETLSQIAEAMAGAPHFCGGKSTARDWVAAAVLALPVERDRRVHTAECVCGVRVTVRMKSGDGAG